MWPLLGTLGIVAIEVSYLPQLVRLYRLKQADEVSVFFPGLNFLGRFMAFLYAMHMGDAVLGLGFLAGMGLRIFFLGQVIWYRWLRTRVLSSRLVRDPLSVTHRGPQPQAVRS